MEVKDLKATMTFIAELCEDAKGDVTKMNRLGVNKACKFYLDNVTVLGTVSPDVFVACYPQYVEEIEGIRLAAEKSAEADAQHVDQGNRIANLEVKLDKLTSAIDRLLEAKTETDETEEEDEEEADPPKRKRGRAKKQVETEEETPPAENAEAEAEAEETE